MGISKLLSLDFPLLGEIPGVHLYVRFWYIFGFSLVRPRVIVPCRIRGLPLQQPILVCLLTLTCEPSLQSASIRSMHMALPLRLFQRKGNTFKLLGALKPKVVQEHAHEPGEIEYLVVWFCIVDIYFLLRRSNCIYLTHWPFLFFNTIHSWQISQYWYKVICGFIDSEDGILFGRRSCKIFFSPGKGGN